MAAVTLRNLSEETHRALEARAAHKAAVILDTNMVSEPLRPNADAAPLR